MSTHRYVCPCPYCARKRAANHVHSGIAYLAAVAVWGSVVCVVAVGTAPSWAVLVAVAPLGLLAVRR